MAKAKPKTTKPRIPNFSDTIVIYHSQDDGCWIAHSLRTDQVGTGVDMVHALADAIRGIDQVLELASEDETIAYLREAPAEIQQRASSSRPIPGEIFDIAHKLARGDWPDEIDPSFLPKNDDDMFRAELQEQLC